MTVLFDTAAPRSILVVCTARIGDVLLSTPVVRSLKARWPDAQIDMLVFIGTDGVLENNPDIRRVVCVAPRTNLGERFADACKIWRKYDLACTLMTSSRAIFYCWFAGRKRIGIVPPVRKKWVRLLLNRFVVERDHSMHVVQSGLSLMTLLEVTPRFEVVPPGIGDEPTGLARLDLLLAPTFDKPFVVMHLYPRYTYKMWHIEGWVAAIAFLRTRGYATVLTGGPAEAEVAYARDIGERAGTEVINLVGKLSLGETAEVIRRARLFIGPDTSASHIAAATGIPTIVLFGPSNPVRWGPWPKGWGDSNPWKPRGSEQRGNVYLLQGTRACVPCKLEGCEANIHSWSDCLLTLDANRTIDAATGLLGIAPNAGRRIPIIARAFTGVQGSVEKSDG
jgi:heptosyltransferase-3